MGNAAHRASMQAAAATHLSRMSPVARRAIAQAYGFSGADTSRLPIHSCKKIMLAPKRRNG